MYAKSLPALLNPVPVTFFQSHSSHDRATYRAYDYFDYISVVYESREFYFYVNRVFFETIHSYFYGKSAKMGRNNDNSSRSGGGRGGRGRGGRGKGKKKADGSKNNAPKKKTELKDYIFKVGSARRSNECEENIKYMLRVSPSSNT